MADKIQFRRGTSARWTEINPVLMEGEVGFVSDMPNQYKMGNGSSSWNELPFRGFDGTLEHEAGDSTTSAMTQKAVTDYVNNVGFFVSNEEYLYALIDKNEVIFFGVRRDGTIFQSTLDDKTSLELNTLSTSIYQELSNLATLVDNKVDKVEGSSLIDDEKAETIELIDNEECIQVVLDSDDKVASYRTLNGVLHENSIETKELLIPDSEAIKTFNQAISDDATRLAFEQSMLDDGFAIPNVLDLSNNDFIEIPIPRCARLNIISSVLPTAKSGMGVVGVTCDIPSQFEFWDNSGNYFKKWVLLSAQGDSSMYMPKKNFGFDMFNGDIADDESASLKFGNWVAQDSFHLKAYYTDFFRGVGVAAYKLYDEMSALRKPYEDRVWKREFITKDDANYVYQNGGSFNNLLLQLDSEPRCYPDGFPVIVYHNSEFYGIYAFQLKKHRDNMMQIKTGKHIHLDGNMDNGSLFGGTINWTSFEVRNPKDLRYHDNGEKYNGDYPREIMGADSPYYNNGNTNYTRSAEVKGYITNLSNYATELNTLIASGATNEVIRARFAEMFDVGAMVDFFCFMCFIRNTDSFNKNWQWTTYDGVKWYVNPYDLDSILGAWHKGCFINPPGENAFNSAIATNLPTRYLWLYFRDEIEEAYALFRTKGVFTADNFVKLMNQWTSAIGTDNYTKEYEKWTESPCNRNNNLNDSYWKINTSFTTYYETGWSSTTTYNSGTIIIRKSVAPYRIYKSLVANNVGNIPEDSPKYWEDITYDPTKAYLVGDDAYYGYTVAYRFTCVADCVGQVPITQFYSVYPYELGHHDNIYRIYNSVSKQIETFDNKFNFNN